MKELKGVLIIGWIREVPLNVADTTLYSALWHFFVGDFALFF